MNEESISNNETTVIPSEQSAGAPLSNQTLKQQNHMFEKTGGISSGNSCEGFIPAFKDNTSGAIFLSRFADGKIAPLHVLDGLPEELVAERGTNKEVLAVKGCVISGFMRSGLFYTREQAAEIVADSLQRKVKTG